MVADNKQRKNRLRQLIKKLNKERKKQAQKIDILCNDLIAAQKTFIQRLKIISFTANFYESIIGSTDLEDLLSTAARLIKTETADANVTFFLRHQGGDSIDLKQDFELHMFESARPINVDGSPSFDTTQGRLENCFSPELMDSICKSNKVCTLDELFAMDLQGHLTGLKKISAVTLPMGLLGSLLGFMLIYRSSEHKLTAAEIDKIRAVSGGLSQAIASCQILTKVQAAERSNATN
jgi:hypothetical protein